MKKENGLTNLIVIIISVIFAIMSALMLFVEGIAIEYLIYGICVAAVIVGIVMIVRYFTKDAYKNVNAYGFSIGTLFVILGICGLLRVSAMAGAILVILGMILLFAGIIMLQHSLDLYRMKDVLRIPTMVCAIAVLICAIMVIMQPFKDSIDYERVIWWMMLVAGCVSLIINIYTLIRVRMYDKKSSTTDAGEDSTGESESKENVEVENVAAGDGGESLEASVDVSVDKTEVGVEE